MKWLAKRGGILVLIFLCYQTSRLDAQRYSIYDDFLSFDFNFDYTTLCDGLSPCFGRSFNSSFGIALRIHKSGNQYIQPSFYFAGRGTGGLISEIPLGGPPNSTYRYQIPSLIIGTQFGTYLLPVDRRLQVSVSAGPYLGLSKEGEFIRRNFFGRVYNREFFESGVDFGLQLQTRVELHARSIVYMAGGGYFSSLTNVSDEIQLFGSSGIGNNAGYFVYAGFGLIIKYERPRD